MFNRVKVNKSKNKDNKIKIGRKEKSKIKQEDNVKNYTIIREKSSSYIPLKKLGFFAKISMTVRYLVDTKYKEKRLIQERLKEEERILNLVVQLRKFILVSLEKVESGAKDIILQIDYKYTEVLEEVLNNTVELRYYAIEEIELNRNYLYYIKKPHILLKFNRINVI